jgi:hypothetical protein
MATNPIFSEEAEYSTGWDCLSGGFEYTYDFWVYTKSSPKIGMTRAEIENYITSGEITVSDLNSRFWTRTKLETDKDRCIKELSAKRFGGSVYSIGEILDKYWPGENKCG